MWGVKYDYIIVTRSFNEIIKIGEKNFGIDRRKFINAEKFSIPYFNWKRYIKLYKSNISIIAEMCYGGFLSHNLGLPFCSPFVNVRIGNGRADYEELLSDIENYMCIQPRFENHGRYEGKDWIGTEGRVDFPRLWYDDIMLHGFHFKSQEEFFSEWEKRRKRFNHKNYFVMKVLFDESDVDKFRLMPFENKLGFYYKDTGDDDILCLDWEKKKMDYAYSFSSFVIDYVRYGDIFKDVDIFKILLGKR